MLNIRNLQVLSFLIFSRIKKKNRSQFLNNGWYQKKIWQFETCYTYNFFSINKDINYIKKRTNSFTKNICDGK